jgi:hypothetical protein
MLSCWMEGSFSSVTYCNLCFQKCFHFIKYKLFRAIFQLLVVSYKSFDLHLQWISMFVTVWLVTVNHEYRECELALRLLYGMRLSCASPLSYAVQQLLLKCSSLSLRCSVFVSRPVTRSRYCAAETVAVASGTLIVLIYSVCLSAYILPLIKLLKHVLGTR